MQEATPVAFICYMNGLIRMLTGLNKVGARRRADHLIHSAKTGSTLCTALRTASVTLAYTSSKALPGGPPHLPGASSGSSCTLHMAATYADEEHKIGFGAYRLYGVWLKWCKFCVVGHVGLHSARLYSEASHSHLLILLVAHCRASGCTLSIAFVLYQGNA